MIAAGRLVTNTGHEREGNEQEGNRRSLNSRVRDNPASDKTNRTKSAWRETPTLPYICFKSR